LEEEVVRCRELGHSMSLLLIRLNELPEHAEQFGEDFRARCRAELAKVALEWKAPTELVGRTQGDALVVILPSARREKAESRAEALAAALAKHNFPRRKRMTAEFGIATYPTDAEDPQELLESVDKSLHEAAGARNGLPRLAQAMAM
jgi:diguanylate cyclase (GGDEF)-like protein